MDTISRHDVLALNYAIHKHPTDRVGSLLV